MRGSLLVASSIVLLSTVITLADSSHVPAGLRVRIEPEEAALAGVAWQVVGEKDAGGIWIVDPVRWSASGGVQSDLLPGVRTIVLWSTLEWQAPPEVEAIAVGGTVSDVKVTCLRRSRYDLGDVPAQTVREGTTLSFLLNGANLSMAAAPVPAGRLSLDPSTGLFEYTPAPEDRGQLLITFRGTSPRGPVEDHVALTPLPELPSEQVVIHARGPVPDTDSKDYVLVTDTESDQVVDFNHELQKVRTVTISGKAVVFENGHDNGLFNLYDHTTGGVSSIQEMKIYGETVIFRDALHLPQTMVTIHARELRFEGAEASLSTVPLDFDFAAPGMSAGDSEAHDGLPGLKGGDVTLRIERFEAGESAQPRLILNGGRGQDPGAGRDGRAGKDIPAVTGGELLRCAGAITFDPNPNLVYAHFSFPLGLTCEAGTKECPGNGTAAVRAGRPGTGGDGGNLASTVDLRAFLEQKGGSSAPRSQASYSGGRAGTPSPAYWVNYDCGVFVCSPAVSKTCEPQAGTDASAINNRSAARPFGNAGEFLIIQDPLSWLHPLLLKSVLLHARDAYIAGNVEYTRGVLEEYRAALDAHALPPADIALELDAERSEVHALLQRLENNLDYFGNPAGWVPMLSFEANRIAFENEIESAFKILYLTYWLGNAAQDAESAASALVTARQSLLDEIEEFLERYRANQDRLRGLEIEATAIADEIDELGRDIKAREAELFNKALLTTGIKKALRVSGAILKAIPAYQPALGAVGAGLDLASHYNEKEPVDKALAGPNAATSYTSSGVSENHDKLQQSATAQPKTGEEAKKNAESNKTVQNAIVVGAAGVTATVKETRTFHKDLEAELARVEATDPVFQTLVADMRKLNVKKQAFVERLVAALEEEVALATGIQQNYLAVDSLNEAAPNVLGKIHHEAFLHIQEMDRRARDRLLKHHYFTARAYEYRMLEEYPGKLNLEPLFNAFQTLADTQDHNLSSEQFQNLKHLYVDQLRSITSDMLAKLNQDPPEQTLPVAFSLSAKEPRTSTKRVRCASTSLSVPACSATRRRTCGSSRWRRST